MTPPGLFLMNDSLGTGGTERQFARLAQALPRDHFRVEIGCLRREGAFLDGLGEVAEFHFGGGSATAASLAARVRLARHLRARNIQIAHSFDWYSNLAMIPVARLAGVAGVIGSHRNLGDWFSPAQFRAEDWAFRMAHRVVCNSQAAAAQLAGRGVPASKLVVIANALPESAFLPAAPSLPPARNRVRIGMIARMGAVKDHAMLLRAAARLLADNADGPEFVLVGDGPLRAGLETMAAELNISSHVRFLGERHDVAEVLASLDIAVLCSTSESLSNAILEAMAAGKPVVATRVGGNPELVQAGETGLLVPSGDDGALAAALTHMMHHPAERHAWGQNAHRFAREHFGLESILSQYENLYSSLLARRAPHRRGQSEGRVATPARAGDGRPTVAIVAPSSRMVGGQAVQAGLLLRNWNQDGRVHARLIPIDPPFPRGLRWAEQVPLLRTVVRTPLYLAALWRGLRGVEVAHVFSASYWSFLLAPAPACCIARARGAKVLINYRSGEARDHLTHWRTARAVLRRADLVVAPSGYLRDVFAEFGLSAQVVPNLVDLSQFHYRRRQPLRPRFVCTRGFGQYYRLDLVVRAFQEIQRRFPAATLTLAGGGPLEAQVRALARELRLEAVTFAGPVARDRIGVCYDEADVFLNASEVDNMPVSVLEAFAAGTPVVTTAAGGIPYIVEHERTGLLSPPGDWQALARHAIRVVEDESLAARLAENAHAESRRYHWDVVSGEWLRLYENIINPGSRQAAAAVGL